MEIKDNDFVSVIFDIYANEKLVQTTDEKKGKDAGLQINEYGPQTIIIGKGFILKALDEAIKKKDNDTIELVAEEAYGKRQKEMIKTFPKSAFDEQKIRPVAGITYDFNGMYGTVKSVIGGRVMVDFNNPLAGKDIKIEYKVESKIEDIKDKLDLVLDKILKVPKDMYKIEVKDKNVKLALPEQLTSVKEHLIKSFEEMISNINDYKIEIESFKKN